MLTETALLRQKATLTPVLKRTNLTGWLAKAGKLNPVRRGIHLFKDAGYGFSLCKKCNSFRVKLKRIRVVGSTEEICTGWGAEPRSIVRYPIVSGCTVSERYIMLNLQCWAYRNIRISHKSFSSSNVPCRQSGSGRCSSHKNWKSEGPLSVGQHTMTDNSCSKMKGFFLRPNNLPNKHSMEIKHHASYQRRSGHLNTWNVSLKTTSESTLNRHLRC